MVPAHDRRDGRRLYAHAAQHQRRRPHDPLLRFMARVGGAHDPTRIENYIEHWREKRHLSSLPNETKFDPVRGMPTGAWIQRLVETVELQAIHDSQLLEQWVELRRRIDSLEAVHVPGPLS